MLIIFTTFSNGQDFKYCWSDNFAEQMPNMIPINSNKELKHMHHSNQHIEKWTQSSNDTELCT